MKCSTEKRKADAGQNSKSTWWELGWPRGRIIGWKHAAQYRLSGLLASLYSVHSFIVEIGSGNTNNKKQYLFCNFQNFLKFLIVLIGK